MSSLVVWTDTDGEHVLEFDPVFQVLAPDHFQRRYGAESEDGSVREILTIGSSRNELAISLRHVIAGKTLDEAQRAGLNGIDLVLIPDSADQQAYYTVQLMEAAKPQRDGRVGEVAHTFTSTWRVRRLDGGELW